jgi:membrane associated rhomboid family serine protease
MMLASIGPILETYWGDKKFLFFYMAAGIGAGIIYAGVNYLFFPGLLHPMLGASGAIYGVLMAFGLVFPEMELSILFLPISFKAKYLVFILGGITYVFDSYFSQTPGQVAHFAHLGGAVVGFIIVTYWKSQGSR